MKNALKRSLSLAKMPYFFATVLAVVFWLPSAFATAPICASVLAAKSYAVESVSMPDRVQLRLDSATAVTFYTNAKIAFDEDLGDGVWLTKALSDLADGQWPTPQSGIAKKLKEFRRRAAILRSQFYLFSDHHDVPEYFGAFTKNFGKLNDEIEFESRKNARKTAKKFLKNFDIEKIQKSLASFRPSDEGDVIKQVQSFETSIQRLLAKPQLTETEFHDLRKLMKHFMNLMQSEMEIHPTQNFKQAHHFLFELNEDLGALRNEALKELFVPEEENADNNPQSTPEPLPTELRRAIQRYFAALDLVGPRSLKRSEIIAKNHLRYRQDDPSWEILMPAGKGRLAVKSSPSFDAAMQIGSKKIDDPLDLDQVRQRAANMASQLLPQIAKAVSEQISGGYRIKFRIKDVDALKEKIFAKAQKKEGFIWSDITDIVGIRILTIDGDTQARIAKLLRKKFRSDVVEDHTREYGNGYFADHIVIEGKKSLRAEIQVMTARMDQWSQWYHDRAYKPKQAWSLEYTEEFATYALSVAKYLRALDEGRTKVTAPDLRQYSILAEDQFPNL